MAVMAVTLGIYWVTPWIRRDRGPYAPDQAVLVDLANRRFYFFFIEIWPQEFYYVAGLLIMAGLGLFLVTSVAGRVWCGTCPQTVSTGPYIWVERLIEGDRNARMKPGQAPGCGQDRQARSVHAVWLLIAVATGGAWIFYFADAPTLLRDFLTLQAAPIAYIRVGILTATTYVFAGYMREQVCTYMPVAAHPGRDARRGFASSSPTTTGAASRARAIARRRSPKGLDVGDCVDCNACVVVCPMGMTSATATSSSASPALCIDACNTVMAKLDQPRGLISYTTLRDYNAHVADAALVGRKAATARQRPVRLLHIARRARSSTSASGRSVSPC